MSKQPLHIIIMGAPGCGKGTQAQQIVTHFDFVHLSTGELFRSKYAQQNEATKAGKVSIDKGGFFSDDIAYRIIQDFISAHKKAEGIIYDGFPRDLAQAAYFLQHVCAKPIVIELQAEEEKLKERLWSRGQQKHRKDDSSAAIIQHRMDLYKKKTYPVVTFFAEKNLVHSYRGDQEIEHIATQIRALLTKAQQKN